MNDDDLGRLAALIDSVAELRQRPKPTRAARALFCKILEPYPYRLVEQAIYAHLSSDAGTYTTALQPAHVVAQIRAMQQCDGRPDVDEAWAIGLSSVDEHTTVIWTDEIAGAMAAATPILAGGDPTGARMAFRAAYQRLVQESRAVGQKANWRISVGMDKHQCDQAIANAVELGLLPQSQLLALPCTTGEESHPQDDSARQHIDNIKHLLAIGARKRSQSHDARPRTAHDQGHRTSTEQPPAHTPGSLAQASTPAYS